MKIKRENVQCFDRREYMKGNCKSLKVYCCLVAIHDCIIFESGEVLINILNIVIANN